jgi:hypothetical protein
MPNRKLRIVRRVKNIPVLGVCELCNMLFPAHHPLGGQSEAQAAIQQQFNAHKCQREVPPPTAPATALWPALAAKWKPWGATLTRNHVSTSFVERQNWTVRTTMRRYKGLSNGFSCKQENYAAATALNYFAYNFIKIHRTLRSTPAMAAGVTDRL